MSAVRARDTHVEMALLLCLCSKLHRLDTFPTFSPHRLPVVVQILKSRCSPQLTLLSTYDHALLPDIDTINLSQAHLLSPLYGYLYPRAGPIFELPYAQRLTLRNGSISSTLSNRYREYLDPVSMRYTGKIQHLELEECSVTPLALGGLLDMCSTLKSLRIYISHPAVGWSYKGLLRRSNHENKDISRRTPTIIELALVVTIGGFFPWNF